MADSTASGEAPQIRRRFVATPSGQVHIAEAGSGAPVLLLHQTPRSWKEFREVLPTLGRGRRAIAMDTRGFGDSDPLPPEAVSIEGWARAVLDVAVAPNADLEAAAAVIGRAAEAVWDLPEAKPDVLDRPEVLGLEYLGPDAATIRVQGKTRPGGQWRVSRLLRVRIAEALSEAGIDLPPSNYIRPGTSPAR